METTIKTLIVNVGSSSLKYSIYKGNFLIEEKDLIFKSQGQLKNYLEKIYLENKEIGKIIHRVVYGEGLPSPFKINKNFLEKLKPTIELDPMHMKNSLFAIKFFFKNFKIKQFACFDDNFHKTMIPEEKVLPFSNSFTKRYNLKKYGFHGIAHESLLKESQKFLKKKFMKVITLQLGGGVSVCAIKNQKSITTTMGYSPVGGEIMQKRSGNLDPEIIFHLKKKGLAFKEIKEIVESKSGLTEISGLKSMKEIVQKKNQNEKAKLAYKIFISEIKKQIGAYAALLGGVDLIVFGGGTNDSKELRRDLFMGLEFLGVKINKNKIKQNLPIQISEGKTKIVVIKTNENKLMFEKCKNL